MRTLRHLPLFWLGLFPLVILLWAWADSRYSEMACAYGNDGQSVAHYVLQDCSLQIGRTAAIADPGHTANPDLAGRTGRWGQWRRDFDSRPGARPAPWFPAAEVKTDYLARGVGFTIVTVTRIIPLWLIVLCYLPLWLILTAWQARRWKRKHAKI